MGEEKIFYSDLTEPIFFASQMKSGEKHCIRLQETFYCLLGKIQQGRYFPPVNNSGEEKSHCNSFFPARPSSQLGEAE